MKLQEVDKEDLALQQLNIDKPTRYDVYGYQDDLRELLKILISDESIKSKSQLFKRLEYTSSKFYRLGGKFSANTRVQDLTKKIDEILESRLIEQGLNGKNFPFVIFLLKNHYGYQDKREVETETTHVFKVSRGDMKRIKDKKVIDLTPKGKPKVAQ